MRKQYWDFPGPYCSLLYKLFIFTIIFGKVAKVSTDDIPYFLFSTVAIIPWTYMSQAMTQSSQSLVQGQKMLAKVYFPRITFPMTPVLARLVDFGISMLIIMVVMLYYRIIPTLQPSVSSIVSCHDGGNSARYWPLVICTGHSIS